MARKLTWSDVRGGILASVVIIAVAAAVLKYARIGALHGSTFPLYVNVGEARGILKGSEVWLNGKKIGKITRIRFRSPGAASSERLGIEMEILEEYRGAMRRDAEAQIRSGGSFIGAPVVYLSAGSAAAPALQPGDTVHAKPQADPEGAVGQFGAASREFPVIIDNVKILTAQLKGTAGTVGAFMNSDGHTSQMARTRAGASRLMATMNGSGTIGRARSGDAQAAMSRAMASADSLRAFLASDKTSFGRFRRDSTLMTNVADVRNDVSIVRAMLDAPTGTAGRALHDSAIVNGVHTAEAELTALMSDMKKHPLRYIKF